LLVFNDNVHVHCGIFSFLFISWIFYHIHLHQYLSFIFTGIFFPQIKFFDVTDDTTLILVHQSNYRVWFMVFNATFNNISVISWQSVLLVEETGVPGENHQPVAGH
jgi:hypothetical protein